MHRHDRAGGSGAARTRAGHRISSGSRGLDALRASRGRRRGPGGATAVALVAAHVKVAAWPAVSEAGAALNVMLGLAFTVTTALTEAVPPAPVQVIV